jgi:hypothetical protein
MEETEIAKLKRRLRYLQEKLVGLGPIMRGSVVLIGTRNKQPYFSMKKDKKTQLIYLGKKREATAKKHVENYKILNEIIDEMTLIYMQLFKEDAITFINETVSNK